MVRKSLKVEAIQEQENQVHSLEWAESVVWAQAGIYQHVWQPFDISSAAKNHKREKVSYSSSPTDLRGKSTSPLPDPFTFLIIGHRRKETSIITAVSIL